jgi:hypothetical protein
MLARLLKTIRHHLYHRQRVIKHQ